MCVFSLASVSDALPECVSVGSSPLLAVQRPRHRGHIPGAELLHQSRHLESLPALTVVNADRGEAPRWAGLLIAPLVGDWGHLAEFTVHEIH